MGENDTAPPTPPELRERIALLAAQVRQLAEPLEREPPPPARALPERPRGPAELDAPAPLDQLNAALIAAAERTAAQIRERALAEAARISGAEGRTPATLDRDREALAALAAEAARLEQGVEALRAQIAALAGELERMRRRLGRAPAANRG